MDNNYEQIYNDYFLKFRDGTLDNELKYDSNVVPTVIELLKSLKNKLCTNEGNVKSEIEAKIKVINGTQAISNKSTNSTFDVMNESNLNTSVTMSDIKGMPAKIEALIGELVQNLETENEIIKAYQTRCTTGNNIEQYRKFLSEHNESDYKPVNIKVNYNGSISSTSNMGDGIGLQHYKDIKQKVEDYDNLASLNNLKNSKLLNKAINKKMAFSEAGQRKPTGNSTNSSSSTPRAKVSSTSSVQTKAFSESNKVSNVASPEVKLDNVKTNNSTDTLKSSNETKKETTTQSSSNMKTDMTKSPINSTTNTKKAETKQSTTKRSSLANGITTSVKSSVSGKSIIEGATSTANKVMDNVEAKVQEVSNEINKVKGTLSSSVKSFNNEKIKPIVKMTSSMVGTDGSKTNKFIPPIAGVTAAAVAGMGTKIYVDKETFNKNKNNEQTKFFNIKDEDSDKEDKEDKKEEQENKNETLSKEDLITILENKN